MALRPMTRVVYQRAIKMITKRV